MLSLGCTLVMVVRSLHGIPTRPRPSLAPASIVTCGSSRVSRNHNSARGYIVQCPDNGWRAGCVREFRRFSRIRLRPTST